MPVGPAAAFGAGNIASISKIEGRNFRHGDIEDVLKALLFLKGGKWTSKQIKRVYFGNWLRDYSQAVDVGTLKGAPADTIRVLVAVLAFLSFGFGKGSSDLAEGIIFITNVIFPTEEFEVTKERLGVYRPEEHIDNPKNYADNLDARAYDPRLRPPVMPVELAVDPETGMKNYIANERGGWATSAGYVKWSLDRSIHHGRLYTSGMSGQRGRKEDLCEALRCLGQALHTMEDFSAHSNYCELVLRELGFDAFPHVGTSTQIYLRGKQVYPIVTGYFVGTFGSTDFLHSVLGEAQDKLTQNEIEELDIAMAEAQEEDKKRKSSSSSGTRGFGGKSSGGSGDSDILKALLEQIPGTQGLGDECSRLQADADAQAFANMNLGGGTRAAHGPPGYGPPGYGAPPGYGSQGGPHPGQHGGGGGGMSGAISAYNPEQLMQRVWPILQFRDRVFRAIESAIEKIPGLVDIVEKISELLSVFIFSLLAPILRPVIEQVALELKKGSNGVIDASAHAQFEPWNDPYCTDPTHSLLSKDHFSNRLNEPCGLIAQSVVKYVVPRIVFAWENPNTPVQVVLDDVIRVFHHPACRDPNLELHNNMFTAVKGWVGKLPDRGQRLNSWLSSEGVRTGKNHTDGVVGGAAEGGHGKVKGSDLDKAGGRVSQKKKGGNADPFSQLAGAIGGQPLQNILGTLLGGTAAAGIAAAGSDYSGKKDKYKDKDKYDDYDRYEKKEKKKDKYEDYDRYERKKAREQEYGGEKKYKSKDKKERVKDEEYYRRKAERRARKEREYEAYGEKKSSKHKHRSRGVDDDSDDDDDSEYDSDWEPEERKKDRERRKSHSKHKDKGRRDSDDEPYRLPRTVDDEYEPQRSSYTSASTGTTAYGYPVQQAAPTGFFGGEGGTRDAPGAYGQQPYDFGNVPGAFPSDTGHTAPYPSGNAAPYGIGGGYVIGSDGTVGRERDYDYDYDYSGGVNRDVTYPDEAAYGAPPPPQDFGYASGGHGNYSGSGQYGGTYGSLAGSPARVGKVNQLEVLDLFRWRGVLIFVFLVIFIFIFSGILLLLLLLEEQGVVESVSVAFVDEQQASRVHSALLVLEHVEYLGDFFRETSRDKLAVLNGQLTGEQVVLEAGQCCLGCKFTAVVLVVDFVAVFDDGGVRAGGRRGGALPDFHTRDAHAQRAGGGGIGDVVEAGALFERGFVVPELGAKLDVEHAGAGEAVAGVAEAVEASVAGAVVEVVVEEPAGASGAPSLRVPMKVGIHLAKAGWALADS
ncbi:LOW QUALITY PROTEIN: hypothetical protein Dda_5890 [Drechslerella dactyloides]|uniref:Het-C-domain-containing protein n=1 Tax=Drechslerella dactyloides TaxID=74499 RepID=A0AAD6IUN3_DREDA|nr:LOW QUALITY PROTEIN: hypothetical protein Dda_5890 [Drechslerella dactyloides]